MTWGRWRVRSHHVIVATLIVWSALKGLRLPNRWAATHLVFNYSHGFIRRGLVGQGLAWLGGGTFVHYRALAVLSYVVLALWWALLIRLVLTSERRRETTASPSASGALAPAWVLTAVFATSMACVFLMHAVGYLDHVGLLLTVTALQAMTRVRRCWLLGAVVLLSGATMVLVHEGQMLMGVPVVLFGALCRAGDVSSPRRRWWGPLVLFVAAAGVTVVLALCCRQGTPSPESVRALQEGLAARVDFPLREDAFSAVDHPVSSNYANHREGFWRDPQMRQPLETSLLLGLPAWLFFVAYALSHVRRALRPLGERVMLGGAALFVSAAPWALNFVGWDVMRWAAQSVTSAYLVCLALQVFVPVRPLARPLPLALPVLVAILGLTTNHPTFLFDDVQVRWFPFAELWSSPSSPLSGALAPPQH